MEAKEKVQKEPSVLREIFKSGHVYVYHPPYSRIPDDLKKDLAVAELTFTSMPMSSQTGYV